MQDTIRQINFGISDTIRNNLDSVPRINTQQAESVNVVPVKLEVFSLKPSGETDTVSVCTRNPVADVTFHDSSSFVFDLDQAIAGKSLFKFVSTGQEISAQKQHILFRALKDGHIIAGEPYKSDWLIPVILFSALLIAVVRAFPGNLFRNMLRFFLFRGVNEMTSRDLSSVFQWQSTLLNLSSFISISLMGFLSIKFFGIRLPGLNGTLLWTICFGIVIVSVTARHLICNFTGALSGQKEIFREYTTGIYLGYQAAGIIFLVLIFLILYTDIVPSSVYFTASYLVAGVLYIHRVMRLFLIFISRHVSILYLILYLCALEILPVVIIVKYITGLV